MKLRFKREFSGDPATLPQRTVEGAVVFREPDGIGKLAIVANLLALLLMALAFIPIVLRYGGMRSVFVGQSYVFFVALLLHFAILMPHELLHAICFREEVSLYTCLKKGMLFVCGTESMSKTRFILMSLLPNLVFGFLPYLLFFLFPDQLWLGVFAVFGIGSGAGDYINVWNALWQMPKGSLCYLSGVHTYWYFPESATGTQK